MRRVKLLVAVERESTGWSITHRGEWREPVERVYRDLAVIEATAAGHAGAATAVIRLGSGTAVCDQGLYQVAVDDILGSEEIRIVAIVDDAILFELKDELAYMATPDAPDMRWRMIWYPEWRFSRTPPAPTPPPQPQRRAK